MIGKRFRSLPFIFANDNYTLRILNSRKFIHLSERIPYAETASAFITRNFLLFFQPHL